MTYCVYIVVVSNIIIILCVIFYTRSRLKYDNIIYTTAGCVCVRGTSCNRKRGPLPRSVTGDRRKKKKCPTRVVTKQIFAKQTSNRFVYYTLVLIIMIIIIIRLASDFIIVPVATLLLLLIYLYLHSDVMALWVPVYIYSRVC